MMYVDSNKTIAGVENTDARIDKYSILKWIFDKMPVRHNDELESLLKDLKNNRNYKELDFINSLYSLVLDNVLANVAGLDCIKIII